MKRSKWKAWLPAIIFAIAIHAVIFAVFLYSRDSTGIKSHTAIKGSKTDHVVTNANATIKNGAASSDIDVSDPTAIDPTKETLTTLTTTTPKASTKNIDTNTSNLSDAAMLAIDNANIQANVQTNQNKGVKNRAQSAINKTQTTPSQVTQRDSVTELTPQPSIAVQPAPIENNTANPTDKILTQRELPNLQSDKISEKEVANIATDVAQTEVINDKLSAVISSVRERNAKKIESMQNQAKKASQKTQTDQVKTLDKVAKQLNIDAAAEAEFLQQTSKSASSTKPAIVVETKDPVVEAPVINEERQAEQKLP